MLTKIDSDEFEEYPIEFMGEHPPLEILLSYNKKDSKLKEVNSESLCANTEE